MRVGGGGLVELCRLVTRRKTTGEYVGGEVKWIAGRREGPGVAFGHCRSTVEHDRVRVLRDIALRYRT